MSTMTVRRVQNETGSHIEPPLRSRWSDLRKLQWAAASVTADTGVCIEIHKARTWRNNVFQHGLFEIRRPGASTSGYTFDRAWTYLNGLAAGYEMAHRQAQRAAAAELTRMRAQEGL